MEQARYLLGGQVRGWRPHRPFVVGTTPRSFTRLWHRGAACPPYPEPCDISVAYTDKPDYNTLTGALLWNPVFEDWPEDARGRNTTVASLENNMAAPLLFAGVAAQRTTFRECLASQATRFLREAVCRAGRPAQYPLGPKEAVGKVDPEFEGIYKPKEEPDDRIPPPPPPAPRALVPTFSGPGSVSTSPAASPSSPATTSPAAPQSPQMPPVLPQASPAGSSADAAQGGSGNGSGNGSGRDRQQGGSGSGNRGSRQGGGSGGGGSGQGGGNSGRASLSPSIGSRSGGNGAAAADAQSASPASPGISEAGAAGAVASPGTGADVTASADGSAGGVAGGNPGTGDLAMGASSSGGGTPA